MRYILALCLACGLVGCHKQDVCYNKHGAVYSCLAQYNDKALEDKGYGGGGA